MAELVTNEFFEQGDIERRNFNITPIVSELVKSKSTLIFNDTLINLMNNYNDFPTLGHNESRERRPATDDASRIHRLDLFTDISGVLNSLVF